MILITGATGTNGQELIRQLSKMGQKLRALVRDPAKADEIKGPNVELVPGDFDHPETLDAALKGVEKAFLLSPVDQRLGKWSRNFIEAAKRAGLKHLVKFSGMGSEVTSAAELLRMHAETDVVLRGSGVPFTILQPNSFFQNMLYSAGTIKSQGKFYLPFKNAPQSLVDVRDINAVAAKVLTSSGHEGQTYTITGPAAITFKQVAATMAAVLGRVVEYVDVPPSAAADSMRQMGMRAWDVTALTDLYAYFASGAAATVTDTVPRLLGRPAISFEQFVKDHRAAF